MNQISECDVVVCNSNLALEQAYDDGLRRNARVITNAPSVALNNPNIANRELGGNNERRRAFAATLGDLALQLHKVLSEDEETRPYALSLSRQAISFHSSLFHLINLHEDDLARPRVSIKLKTGEALVDLRLESPIARIIDLDGKSFSAMYEVEVKKELDAIRPPLLDWLSLATPSEFVYRLAKMAWRSLRLNDKRRRVVIISENELVREAGAHLAKMGYAVLFQSPPAVPEQLYHDDRFLKKVNRQISEIMADYLRRWVPEPAIQSCLDYIQYRIASTIAQQTWATGQWPTLLDPYISDGKTAVLVNFPGNPSMIALGDYCRLKNVPLVALQHGVTREICMGHDNLMANFENGVADLFLTFNDQAKKVSDRSPYAHGITRVVGLPGNYRALKRKKGLSKQPVLYISTNLYSGNATLINGYLSDIGRCKRELDIVKGVLAKLPYRILYKSYPSDNRYADKDPVIECVQQVSNIDLYDQPINLKYLVAKHRVLITSRATSTLSVCLMSGRPLVFVNMPDHAPLRPELKAMFREALFYFDYADDDVLNNLKAFLSRPIEDIEHEWAQKKSARDVLLNEYFEGPGKGAGARAAKAIDELVSQSGKNAQ